jgi:hypothetical protein
MVGDPGWIRTSDPQLRSLMFGPAFDSIGSFPDSMFQTVAVGMGVVAHPPHRSVRAAFPHTALTLGV